MELKSRVQVRLECLRMASSMCCAKMIDNKRVVAMATEFFNWVQGEEDEKTNGQTYEEWRRLGGSHA